MTKEDDPHLVLIGLATILYTTEVIFPSLRCITQDKRLGIAELWRQPRNFRSFIEVIALISLVSRLVRYCIPTGSEILYISNPRTKKLTGKISLDFNIRTTWRFHQANETISALYTKRTVKGNVKVFYHILWTLITLPRNINYYEASVKESKATKGEYLWTVSLALVFTLIVHWYLC